IFAFAHDPDDPADAARYWCSRGGCRRGAAGRTARRRRPPGRGAAPAGGRRAGRRITATGGWCGRRVAASRAGTGLPLPALRRAGDARSSLLSGWNRLEVVVRNRILVFLAQKPLLDENI